MADELYGFDAQTAERITTAVAKIEADNPIRQNRPPLHHDGPPPLPFDHQVVRVTTATPTVLSGVTVGCAGFVQAVMVSSGAVTYTDLGACYVTIPVGTPASIGYFLSRRTGPATDGKPIFVTTQVGLSSIIARLSTGTGPSYSFVQVQQASGTITDVPSGITGTCYDLNGGTGLTTGSAGTGTVVWLTSLPNSSGGGSSWVFVFTKGLSTTISDVVVSSVVCGMDGTLTVTTKTIGVTTACGLVVSWSYS